jgi:hypothetical protein
MQAISPMDDKPSLASSLCGTWRLLSFVIEDQSSTEKRLAYATGARGRLVILPNGLLLVFVAAHSRPSPKSVEDRAASFNTMLAYSGQYEVHGDELSTKVDLAWNEDWTNSVQIRYFKFVGSRLQLSSAWAPSPYDTSKTLRGILEWERERGA